MKHRIVPIGKSIEGDIDEGIRLKVFRDPSQEDRYIMLSIPAGTRSFTGSVSLYSLNQQPLPPSDQPGAVYSLIPIR